jgi:hypothetical protein
LLADVAANLKPRESRISAQYEAGPEEIWAEGETQSTKESNKVMTMLSDGDIRDRIELPFEVVCLRE